MPRGDRGHLALAHTGASGDLGIRVGLRYRGRIYQLEDGHWRGPDAAGVHLLTWVTDDLVRAGPPASDLEAARRVADRLGDEATLVVKSDPGQQ